MLKMAMGKIETRKKHIQQMFPNIIKLGYCEAQFLLRCLNPSFYTHGVYGWNADVYIYNDETVIVTGYRPFGNINVDHDTVKAYDKKAYEIWESKVDYTEKRKKVYALLREMMSAYVWDVEEV